MKKGCCEKKVEAKFGKPMVEILWELENKYVMRKMLVKEMAKQLGHPLITLYFWRNKYGITKRK